MGINVSNMITLSFKMQTLNSILKIFNLLLKTSIERNVQVVYGSRDFKKTKFKVPFATLMANRILSLVTSLLSGKKLLIWKHVIN